MYGRGMVRKVDNGSKQQKSLYHIIENKDVYTPLK